MITRNQNMWMRTRGLSDVVATVLIVLLALAAVAIIWSFIRPALERSGTAVQTQSACLEVEVKATSCDIKASGAVPPVITFDTVVQLVKAPGSGVTNIEAISIVTDKDGLTSRLGPIAFTAGATPPVGTTQPINGIANPGGSTVLAAPYRASAAAVVTVAGQGGQTQTITCDSAQVPIPCS